MGKTTSKNKCKCLQNNTDELEDEKEGSVGLGKGSEARQVFGQTPKCNSDECQTISRTTDGVQSA